MTDALLKWANRNTRGHDDIIPADDYEESWNDGLCFCALYYAYFPDKIPHLDSLQAETDEEKISNLNLAFQIGNEIGVERLLDAEDTMLVHEKKSIMLYISEMYGVLKDLPVKFQASAEWNKKYEADEKARKFAEWKLKKEVEAKGEVFVAPHRVTSSRSVLFKLKSQPQAIKKEEPPAAVSETPSRTSRTYKREPEHEKPPVQPPVIETITTPSLDPDDQVGLTYDISGRGKEGGNEGRMCIFSVSLRLDGKTVPNPSKEDLKVHMEGPGGPPRLNIMGGSGGTYHIGFTPTEGGQYWFDFVWRGHWCKEPYMLPVKTKQNKIPDHPYVGAERKAETPNSGRDTSKKLSAPPEKPRRSSQRADPPAIKEPCAQHSICSGRTCEMTDEDYGSFNITCKDSNGLILQGDYQFDIKVNGPSPVESKIINNGDGTYKCSFGPANAGEYTVQVSYKGTQLNHGTWDVNVLEAIGGIEFEDITILFHATEDNQSKTCGGDLEHFSIVTTGKSPEIFDLEDGRYTLDYHVIKGQNSIDVSTQGVSLGGFPLTWTI